MSYILKNSKFKFGKQKHTGFAGHEFIFVFISERKNLYFEIANQ